MRTEFLRDTVCADIISVGQRSEAGFEIPIYRLKDPEERKRLGLDQTHIARWMSSFVESKSKSTPSHVINEILMRLKIESVSWLEAERLKLANFEAVNERLRRFDQQERLYDNYASTVVELNDPKCSISRFVALDIEAYERAQRKLTEFGVTIYDRDLDWLESHHIIIKEHAKLRNSHFAPDAKGDFAFGVSDRLSTSDAMRFLSEQLAEPNTALIGHALPSDLRFLRRAKLNKGRRISDTLLGQVKMYDMQYLHRCKKMSGRNYKLTDILKELGINHDGVHMHNAGNDATFTMRAFINLMGLSKRETAFIVDKQPLVLE
jgi:hypothetical protein